MISEAYSNLLKTNTIVPLDGAWGTELSRFGLPSGAIPELWNLEQPAAVAAVPRAYADAGARIVLTNTFGASSLKLAKSNLASYARAINEAGSRISKTAVPLQVLVFGSVGPSGDFLEPLGPISPAQLEAVFREQIEGLVAGGVDGVIVETMTDLEEALCGLRAAKAVNPQLPVAVSLTFDKGLKGYATMMGITPRDAAQRLEAEGADIIGTNCGNGIENMIDIVRELAQATRRPLWARPNAGLPQLLNGATVFPASPADMAAHVPALIDAGARFVGGCCGTTPAHISAIAAMCQTRKPVNPS